MLIQHIENQSNYARIPGGEGIWVFVFGDLVVFSLLFSVFLFHRFEDIPVFLESRNQLNFSFGLINTLVLLVSSWSVAEAVRSYRNQNIDRFLLLIKFSITLGAVFCVIKFFEYSAKIDSGLTLVTNDFFMFYYIMTGIHLFHVLIGMAALLWVHTTVAHHGFTASRTAVVEASGVFWHMVDLLWIILFSLLYLLP